MDDFGLTYDVNLRGIWGGLTFWYFTFEGKVTPTLIGSTAYYLLQGFRNPFVILISTLAFWFFGIYLLLSRLFLLLEVKQNKFGIFLYSALIVIAFCKNSPAEADLWYWPAAVFDYSVSLLLFVFMLSAIERWLKLSIILAFLAGACKLNYIGPMYLIIMSITAFRYKKNIKYYTFLNAAFIAGSLIYLLAPGNFNRLSGYHFTTSIAKDFPVFIHTMRMYLVDLRDVRNYIILLPFLFTGIKYGNQINRPLLTKLAIYTTAFFTIVVVLNYFTFYFISHNGIYSFRVWDMIYLTYILLIIILYIYIGTLLTSVLNTSPLPAYVISVLLVFSGFRMVSGTFTLVPLFRNYANAEDDRVRQIIEYKTHENKGVLCLKKLPSCPVLPANEISTDTAYWQNKDVVNRFGGSFSIKLCE
jgi:hypothetical protein